MKTQSQEEKDTILLAENHEKIKKIVQGEGLSMLEAARNYNELYHKMDTLWELVRECKTIYWNRYVTNQGAQHGLTSPSKTS